MHQRSYTIYNKWATLNLYHNYLNSLVIQVNLDMTDSMGPGKLVHHMQNPSYTYDKYLICIGLGPSISSVICKNPSYSGPSYPSSPVQRTVSNVEPEPIRKTQLTELSFFVTAIKTTFHCRTIRTPSRIDYFEELLTVKPTAELQQWKQISITVQPGDISFYFAAKQRFLNMSIADVKLTDGPCPSSKYLWYQYYFVI